MCGINPGHLRSRLIRRVQKGGMRFTDTEEVIGSIPIPPTITESSQRLLRAFCVSVNQSPDTITGAFRSAWI